MRQFLGWAIPFNSVHDEGGTMHLIPIDGGRVAACGLSLDYGIGYIEYPADTPPTDMRKWGCRRCWNAYRKGRAIP